MFMDALSLWFGDNLSVVAMIAARAGVSIVILRAGARHINTVAMSSLIESPCVKVCAIDATTGWCLGCGRSMVEIGAWSTLAPARRRAVMDELEARKARIDNREVRSRDYRLPGS